MTGDGAQSYAATVISAAKVGNYVIDKLCKIVETFENVVYFNDDMCTRTSVSDDYKGSHNVW